MRWGAFVAVAAGLPAPATATAMQRSWPLVIAAILCTSCNTIAGFDDLTYDNPNSATGAGAAGGNGSGGDDGGGGAASAYATAVLEDNPVAYWRLDEAPGSLSIASTVGNYPGLVLGGVTLGEAGALTGDANTAARFDGIDGKVDFGDVLGFDGGVPFTIEAWISVTEPYAEDQGILTKRRGTMPREGYSCRIDASGQLQLATWVADAEVNNDTTGALTLGEWYHAVCVYDGTNIRVFLDSASTTPDPAPPWGPTPDSLVMGEDGSADFFGGSIDEVAVYDYVLPLDRIAAHAAAR